VLSCGIRERHEKSSKSFPNLISHSDAYQGTISTIHSALQTAIKMHDLSVLSRTAAAVVGNPACVGTGIPVGQTTWYTIRGGCNNFGYCAACYTGYIEIFGIGHLFEKIPAATLAGCPETLVCCMNPGAPRFLQFALKLLEATETGPWSVFTEEVRAYAEIPVCPGKSHVGERKWFGWDDCLICEDCNREWVMPTMRESATSASPPTKALEMQHATAHFVSEVRMCCMYSPRMRTKFLEALKTGSANDLLTYSVHRHAVYQQTIPRIDMLKQLEQMRMMNSMSLGMAGLMYQGAGSIQAAAGATDGYQHGNSSVGWHETENHATAAGLMNQSRAGMSGMGGWPEIFMLASMWDEVE
jgi:hypothetical protein